MKTIETSGFTQLEPQEYDCCDSNTMFILDNGEGQFAVQLEIMLKCIKFAADKGKIPPIPDDWWVEVVGCCDRSIIET